MGASDTPGPHLIARRRSSTQNATTPPAIGARPWRLESCCSVVHPTPCCVRRPCTRVPASCAAALSLAVRRSPRVCSMQQPNGAGAPPPAPPTAAPVASTSQVAPTQLAPAQPSYAPLSASAMHAPVAGPSTARTDPIASTSAPYKRPRAPTPDALPSDEDILPSSDDEPVVPLLAGRKRRANAGSRCVLGRRRA